MANTRNRVRYDGSSCINVRSITTAIELLSAQDTETPITRHDLATLLWFIETCVMSNHLYFDGTVPQPLVDRVTEEVAGFRQRFGVSELSISPISLKGSKEILDSATAAIVESGLLLESFEFDERLDRPVPDDDDYRLFRSTLDEEHGTESDRLKDRAVELVTDRFRGSKCLAGILNAGPQAVSVVQSIYRLYPDQPRLVSGALINRFRLNYLNELASGRRSAYVPNPNFEELTKLHAHLFKDFLLERMVREVGHDIHVENILVENLQQQVPLPPLGLYTLMTTKSAGNPVALLNDALESFRGDPSFQKMIWKVTREAMTLKQREAGLEELHGSVDDFFSERYKATAKAAEGIKALGSRSQAMKEYLIPAAVGAITGLAPLTFGVGVVALLCKALGGVATGATARVVGDKLVKSGFNTYISQYRNLRWEFAHEEALRQPMAALESQVERVFGRRLV